MTLKDGVGGGAGGGGTNVYQPLACKSDIDSAAYRCDQREGWIGPEAKSKVPDWGIKSTLA